MDFRHVLSRTSEQLLLFTAERSRTEFVFGPFEQSILELSNPLSALFYLLIQMANWTTMSFAWELYTGNHTIDSLIDTKQSLRARLARNVYDIM